MTWQGEHYVAGATPFSSTTCSAPGDTTCDHFQLTVDVDLAYWERADGGVEISIANAAGVYDVQVNPFTVVNSDYSGRAMLHSTQETGDKRPYHP